MEMMSATIGQTARDYADIRAEKTAETNLKRPKPYAGLSKPLKILNVRKRKDYAPGIAVINVNIVKTLNSIFLKPCF
ncbi:hypothetical protein TNIN_12231 [Trichonephila inaurata madagascariensis]|uniref:Uncharacterized protein n=1 Tax=Trichonephila inaurata madagascariensis TaxID=2747483 RepID=A0A8X6WNZ1_9ARAC|nr:hypothetical protein TNIN_12231 [Trichonephila inaurata madagascariensis]